MWLLIHGSASKKVLLAELIFSKSRLKVQTILDSVCFPGTRRRTETCDSIPLDDFLAITTNSTLSLPKFDTFKHFLVWP
jgi:hypothetical protein